jgi:hypothetical protein
MKEYTTESTTGQLTPPPSLRIRYTKGPGPMPVLVHLNQKGRNSGENRAENSGTDDALHHVHRAT